MSDRDPGVPDALVVRSDSLAVSCGYLDRPGRRWIEKQAPADESWRSVLDCPATLDSGVTVGSFIRLFDIPDPEEDARLFFAFTSLSGGPFGRWVRALDEPGIPPLPEHMKTVDIEPVVGVNQEGVVHVGAHPPHLGVTSRGTVDDSFWGGMDRFSWGIRGIPLTQLAPLPLRLDTEREASGDEGRKYHVHLTLRQIIQAVFTWCPPANRSSDLRPSERIRYDVEIEAHKDSLKRCIGLESPSGGADRERW